MSVDLEGLEARVAEALTPEFELLRRAGSGRTAHVFIAREPALRRLVAIKVLRPEVGHDETVRARFEREARSEARLSHPCVPAIHRVGRLEGGLPYLIQEYVEGRTLRDRLDAAGRVRPAEARRILGDLAGALAAAHEHGVIHRDVRPENVMLERESGRAVLMDFGIAAFRDTGTAEGPRLTRTGEVLGDPRYASPEQLRGEKVTPQTDVYSLGVLGYEMLTLSNPFGSRSARELIGGHLRDEPVEMPWEVTATDPDLAVVLRRCLRKDPGRRPRARDVGPALSADGGGGEAGAGRRRSAGSPTSSLLAPFPKLAAFVAELRRRRVYRVAAAYAVAAFALLEGTGLVLEGITAPGWLYSALVVAVLAGFPVAMVLAWVFDVTGGRVRRTSSADAPAEAGSGRALKIAGLVASAALAVVAGWLMLRGR